jgi:Ca-activated chloride channel family protein
VLIYAIGLLDVEGSLMRSAGKAREAKDARGNLEDLATASGGESFFPTVLRDVDQIAWRVARDIRNQYIVAYTSSIQAMDSTYRKIRIAVNAPRRPVVHTRSGYYATPE